MLPTTTTKQIQFYYQDKEVITQICKVSMGKDKIMFVDIKGKLFSMDLQKYGKAYEMSGQLKIKSIISVLLV